nr:hypothetical protein [Maribacter arcticus]
MTFCTIISNTFAVVAITIETKTLKAQIARKPAGSSSRLWNNLIYTPAIAIKMLSTIAQYFILFNILIELDENTLCCPM